MPSIVFGFRLISWMSKLQSVAVDKYYAKIKSDTLITPEEHIFKPIGASIWEQVLINI